MELRPILSAMLRNKTGAILVALQIAITLAVVTNAVFIINQRLEKIGRPSGMDTDNIFFVQSQGYAADYNHNVTVQEDLELIRKTPGVIAASTINGIPLSGGGSSTSYKVDAQESTADVSGNYYEIDEQGLDALGVKLVAGRGFSRVVGRLSSLGGSGTGGATAGITRDWPFWPRGSVRMRTSRASMARSSSVNGTLRGSGLPASTAARRFAAPTSVSNGRRMAWIWSRVRAASS